MAGAIALRRRGDSILSVPGLSAGSTNLAVAPDGSATLSAAQYVAPLTSTETGLLPGIGMSLPALRSSVISVNPSQVSTVTTYVGPSPIGCTLCGQPTLNTLVINGNVVNPAAVAVGAGPSCCPSVLAPVTYT